MSRHATTLVAPVLAALALLLAGCSDDGGSEGEGDSRGRPTVEEMAAVLDTGGLDETQLDCLAQAFVDSEMSDQSLQAIVDGGGLAGARGVSAEDEAAAQDAAAQGLACSVAADLPSATADESTTTAAEGPTTTAATTTTAAG
jgi:hypothetical protein